MNWDVIEGKWDQWKARVREKWGELTDDDMQTIGGKKDRLMGALQERYGYTKDRASHAVDEFIDSFKKQPDRPHDAPRS